MKSLCFLFASLIMGTKAHANFECISAQNLKARILVQTPLQAGPTTLTVQLDGKIVYSLIAVIERTEGTRTTYQAPTLRNGRNASADLFLQIYLRNGQVLGEFSEQSYVPVVPNFSVQCRQIR